MRGAVYREVMSNRPGPLPSKLLTLILATVGVGAGCAAQEPDDEGTEADQVGVAAQCVADDDCNPPSDSDGPDFALECLMDFKGGYCGVIDCTSHDDCPQGSGCVDHDDGSAYCFRLCVDKAECNAHRDADAEANCSSNITYLGDDLGKACVPPQAS